VLVEGRKIAVYASISAGVGVDFYVYMNAAPWLI
jgi:hypothetical protein